MPSWTIHLAIVDKVCKKVQISNDNLFAFANIMPDIFEGHKTPNPSTIAQKYSTHYPYNTVINGMKVELPDLQKFKKQYEKDFKNPIILGYYTHLLTDNYWNSTLYKNHYEMYDEEKGLLKIKMNNGATKIFSFIEIQKIKHKDLEIFSQYLNNEANIKYPTYDEKILEYSKTLKEFTYTISDIQKTIQYIEENIKSQKEKVEEHYQLFTKQELIEYMNKSVQYIEEEILESSRI